MGGGEEKKIDQMRRKERKRMGEDRWERKRRNEKSIV